LEKLLEILPTIAVYDNLET